MPRIRTKRDTDWTPTNEDFPEALSSPNGDQQDDAEDSTSYRPYEGYEGDSDSGASWLSNAVVIGSLSDNKLRDALGRYRAIVRLCETELAARALAPRRTTWSHDGRVAVADALRQRRAPRIGTRSRRDRTQLLTPQQMLKALEMLIQLKDKHNNVKDRKEMDLTATQKISRNNAS